MTKSTVSAFRVHSDCSKFLSIGSMTGSMWIEKPSKVIADLFPPDLFAHKHTQLELADYYFDVIKDFEASGDVRGAAIAKLLCIGSIHSSFPKAPDNIGLQQGLRAVLHSQLCQNWPGVKAARALADRACRYILNPVEAKPAQVVQKCDTNDEPFDKQTWQEVLRRVKRLAYGQHAMNGEAERNLARKVNTTILRALMGEHHLQHTVRAILCSSLCADWPEIDGIRQLAIRACHAEVQMPREEISSE